MNKKIPCENCGLYLDEVYIHKNKDGKKYCNDCQLITSGISPSDIKPISKKGLEKVIKAAVNTPPLLRYSLFLSFLWIEHMRAKKI